MNEPKGFVTRNQLLKIYQDCPGLLAEDLDYIFGESKNEADIAVHNHIVKKIQRICPSRGRMLLTVATAIIKNITEQE